MKSFTKALDRMVAGALGARVRSEGVGLQHPAVRALIEREREAREMDRLTEPMPGSGVSDDERRSAMARLAERWRKG